MYASTQKELAPEEDQGILFNLVKTPPARQPRLSRAGHRPPLQRLQDDPREASTCSPSTAWAARAPGLRRHPAQAVGGAQPHAGADPAGTAAQADRHRRRPGLRLRQPVAAGLDRRPAGAIRHHARPATTSSSRRCWSRCSRPRRRAACSSSPTATCKFDTPQIEVKIDHAKANRSASPCRTSAPRWRRCSAATTSTASTSTAAAIRSSRRCRATSASTPDWLDALSGASTAIGRHGAAVDRRDGRDSRCSRTR